MKVLNKELIFKQVFTLIFIFISTIASAQSSSETAGQVIITSGPFQAMANNNTRALTRGSYFYSGDTLITGTNSTAQVRFSDGTVLAMSPNSRMKVDEYVYHGDSKLDKSVVTLVKGGFRALTGLISKENPDAYKLQTPVAVIGVRGTNYGGVLTKEGKLYTGVWKGCTFVKNTKGAIELGSGCAGAGGEYNYAEVASKDSAPIGLLYPPAELVGHCGYH